MGVEVASLPAIGLTPRSNLNEMSAAWNRLYAAAFGRSFRPLINPELAERVAASYEGFRAWASTRNVGPLDTLLYQYVFTQEVAAWEATRLQLGAEVSAETGVPLDGPITPLPQEMARVVARTAARAATAVMPFGRMLTGLLLASAVFLYMWKRPATARRTAK